MKALPTDPRIPRFGNPKARASRAAARRLKRRHKSRHAKVRLELVLLPDLADQRARYERLKAEHRERLAAMARADSGPDPDGVT